MTLPVEMHARILSHLDDAPTLSCMTLVSKSFSVLATPHLYSSVTLFALETLLARPDLCTMVKKAEINLHSDLSGFGIHGRSGKVMPPPPSQTQIERFGLSHDFLSHYKHGDADALAVVLLHLLANLETVYLLGWYSEHWILFESFPNLGHGPPVIPAALRSVTSIVACYNYKSAAEEKAAFDVEHVMSMLSLPALKRLSIRSINVEATLVDEFRQRTEMMYGTSQVEKLEFHDSAIAPEHLAQLVQIPRCLRHFHYGHGGAYFSYDDGWIVRALEPVRESLWTLVVTDEDDDHENALAPGALGSLDGFTNLRYSQTDAKFSVDEDDAEGTTILEASD
jgi:hypothetical protein